VASPGSRVGLEHDTMDFGLRGTRYEQLEALFEKLGSYIEHMEAQLVVLSEKAGVPYEPYAPTVPADVAELARAGKTLDAIKRYRELTGASMDEAKAVIAGI